MSSVLVFLGKYFLSYFHRTDHLCAICSGHLLEPRARGTLKNASLEGLGLQVPSTAAQEDRCLVRRSLFLWRGYCGCCRCFKTGPRKLSLRSNAWLSDLLSLVVQSHVMNSSHSSPFGQSSERVNASAGG